MYFTTTVKVVLEGSKQPLGGVQVSLFDRDVISRDDLLGSGETNDNGEVTFHYSSEQFVDLEDRLSGEMPDLYAIVYDPQGNTAVSTRAETISNQPRKNITVTVPRQVAEKHGWGAAVS